MSESEASKKKPEIGGSTAGSVPKKGVCPYELPKVEVTAIDERDQKYVAQYPSASPPARDAACKTSRLRARRTA